LFFLVWNDPTSSLNLNVICLFLEKSSLTTGCFPINQLLYPLLFLCSNHYICIYIFVGVIIYKYLIPLLNSTIS
jgi:hypothetical protein